MTTHWYNLWLLLVPLLGALACALIGQVWADEIRSVRGVIRVERSNPALAARAITVLCALIVILLAWLAARNLDARQSFDAFSGALPADKLGLLGAGVSALLTALAVAVAVPLETRLRPHRAEFHALLLLALAGAVLSSMSADLVGIAVGLELLWLPLVLLPALAKTDRLSVRGAARHLIWSGVCTVLTLLGFAILAGMAGATSLTAVQLQLSIPGGGAALPAVVALALIVVGLGARLGLPPLGHWVVDVLEGAPAAAAAPALSIGVLASFTALARLTATVLLSSGLHPAPGAYGAVGPVGYGLLAVVALLALLVGLFHAFIATTIGRLLAGILTVQSGVLLMALLALTQHQRIGGVAVLADPEGLVSGLVLAGTAGLCWMGTLGVLAVVEGDRLVRGTLPRVRPELGVPLLLGVLCVAGAPPLAGFWARILVFQSGVIAGYPWLVLIALLAGLALVVPAVRVLAPLLAEPGEAERSRYVTLGARAASIAFAFVTVLLPVLGQPIVSMAAAAANVHGP